MAKKKVYDNDSISSLKGADRVPDRISAPMGWRAASMRCLEIISNAIDEARAGFGRLITVTRFLDKSIQVEDQGRGLSCGLERKGGAVQLGAGVLRDVRRRQIRPQPGKTMSSPWA